MPLLLVLLLIVGTCFAPRINELFLVSVREGRVLVVRGRVPPSLLDAVSDVARDARVERATLRAVRGSTHARLLVSGVDDGVAQRFRNVFGIHPIHELRQVPRSADRNAGQWLGWAWLAWLLLRR
jgi:hypothetical protein